eukprot:UN14441
MVHDDDVEVYEEEYDSDSVQTTFTKHLIRLTSHTPKIYHHYTNSQIYTQAL